uniref:Uncharacterized protein n=1 Tax=Rousettus aegyptiacus TaxID=9407 RepID=A0A7J8DI60_ROUAE|nr:hypothetical protein HJG63_008552 [Rousettus aegyptiacus]
MCQPRNSRHHRIHHTQNHRGPKLGSSPDVSRAARPPPCCNSLSANPTNGLCPSVSTTPVSVSTPTLQGQTTPSLTTPSQDGCSIMVTFHPRSYYQPLGLHRTRLCPLPSTHPRTQDGNCVPPPHPQTKTAHLQFERDKLLHQMFPRHSF